MTPGHTPGHQSLELKLKTSGAVLLPGDLYHQRDSRKLGLVPSINYVRATLWLLSIVSSTSPKTPMHVVIQHDLEDFERCRSFLRLSISRFSRGARLTSVVAFTA